MKLRKGWIFRAIYLGRKNLIAAGAFYIIFMILGILVRLSMKVGNLANIEDAEQLLDPMSYYLFTLFPVIVISMTMYNLETMTSEIKCGWTKYAKTLPLSAKEQSAYIYGIMLLFYVITLVLSVINLLVFNLICGKTFSVEIINNDFAFIAVDGFHFDATALKIILVIMMFSTMISVEESLLMMHFKNASRVQVISFVISMLLYFAMLGLLYLYMNTTCQSLGIDLFNSGISEEEINQLFGKMFDDLDKLLNTIQYLVPMITIGTFAVGFFGMKHILEKGEH